MEPARAGTDQLDSRFDELHAEAKAAVGYSANTLRSVRERNAAAYAGAGEAWVLEVAMTVAASMSGLSPRAAGAISPFSS